MSRHVVAESYGGPEVLVVADRPSPQPGPGEVRIRVRAAAVNPIDLKAYSGRMGDDPAALPMPIGAEAAGEIVALGSEVTSVSVGDPVIVFPAAGAAADELVVQPTDLTPLPPALGWEEGSGLMLAGAAAADALAAAELEAGETILVHGGAGGVGQMLIQLAIHRGIEVVATAGPDHHELIRSLGAVPIDHHDGLLGRARIAAPGGYAAAIDLVGSDQAIDVSLALLDPERVISLAAFGRMDDGIVLLDGSGDFRLRIRPELAALAGAGTLQVRVDRTYRLDQVAAAHAYLGRGHAAGKVVLLP